MNILTDSTLSYRDSFLNRGATKKFILFLEMSQSLYSQSGMTVWVHKIFIRHGQYDQNENITARTSISPYRKQLYSRRVGQFGNITRRIQGQVNIPRSPRTMKKELTIKFAIITKTDGNPYPIVKYDITPFK